MVPPAAGAVGFAAAILSAPVRAAWVIQQATQVANQAKAAIRLSAVRAENARARSTAGTATAALAAMIRSGRSQVTTATHTLGLTITPRNQSMTAGAIVMSATITVSTAALPSTYSQPRRGRVK